MSGPDNYREAQAILRDLASNRFPHADQIRRIEYALTALTEATLAVAAATALHTLNGGLSPETRTAWAEATT